ncbi:MAG TPA: substrate-binding domain-containing protein [Polyangiaceae bacterium]|nr:substrate-binding domain-containing protein [Polyangiaceae bacterium]
MAQRRFHSQPLPARPSRRALLWSALGLCTLAERPARAESAPAFRILIHPENPITSLSQDFVTDVFLKRVTRWRDGENVRPVDQRADSAVRKAFSQDVLQRSVAAVKRYWQQRIFSGRDLPPPELENDEAVVGYVLKHRGAIGYVSAAAKLDRTKAVSVR